ncbi:helix-turn-helix domain-containing protein [Cohnella sp. GCM10020058]|uniref:helix-turn-helix domain-containing protein n=1 Tax=Cohnella sp. GCM10020058 TaxID=3317330 RepID=UPI00362A9FAC
MNGSVYMTADRFPLVRDVGFNRVEGIYEHHDRTLDFDVFFFVVEGSMKVIEEGIEYIVREGEYLFLRGGLHHWGVPFSTPGTGWYWIHFSAPDSEAPRYREHAPMSGLDAYFPDHYAYRMALPKLGIPAPRITLGSRLDDLIRRFAEPRAYAMTRLSLDVYALFLELAEPASDNAVLPRAASVSQRIIPCLIEHADRPFDADALGKRVNLNYSYMSAAFRKETGQSIIEAHTKLRMNKAVELMREGRLNVSEISERLGFPNPYYFSRVFKKTLGSSPSAYRKRFY